MCPGGQKVCGTDCVSADPSHGCQGESCVACPPDKNWATTCSAGGQCQCAAGYGNCDDNPDNGCEEALNGTTNCGACHNVCGMTGAVAVGCDAGACAFTCSANRAHCGPSDSSGCETALDVDSKNCGYCGHDCLGGSCTNSACQPTLLAADNGNIENLYGLDRRTTNLFVTNNCHGNIGYVFETPTAASDAGPTAPSFVLKNTFDAGNQDDCVAWLADDGTSLFFTIDQSGVWTMKPDGTGVALVQAVPHALGALAVDATNIYYVAYGDPGGTIEYQLKSGGGANPPKTSQIDTSTVAQILTDPANNLVFTARGSGVWVQAVTVTGTLNPGQQVDLDADAGPGASPTALAIGGGYMYWGSGTKIFRVADTIAALTNPVPQDVTPLDGMGQRVLTTGINRFPAGLLVVDATSIYWVFDFSDGAAEIWRSNANGTGSATKIATLPTGSNVNAITQDDKALYFTVGGTLSAVPAVYAGVYKLAK